LITWKSVARIGGRAGPDPIAKIEVNLRRKLLDAILLLIALVGGVLVWQTGREQSRLQAKIDWLTRTTGDFSITDPSKIHVVALATGEPLHFAWRVYLPADYELVERGTPAWPVSASPAGSVPSRELILRARFREDAEGRLNLYENLESQSSRTQFGAASLSKVLHGRFDKVLVEQLGRNAVVSVGVDEPLDLLKLKLPADMEAEIVKEMSPDERTRHNPEFFSLSFGPEAKPSTPPVGGN
jgi:hypothetical protein